MFGVSVLAALVSISGEPTSQSCYIENLKVSIQQNEDSLCVSWEYDTSCESTFYQIKHVVNDETLISKTYHEKEIELEKFFCTTNEITVTARTVDGVNQRAIENFEIDHKEMGPVQNLTFNEDKFEWQRPPNSELCDVTYDVSFKNQLGVQNDETVDTFFNFDVHTCADNRIQVTPLVDGDFGQTESSTYIQSPTDVGVVENLVFRNGRFEWKRPPLPELCTVTYDVIFNDITTKVIEEYFEFPLDPCTTNTIQVVPIVLGLSGSIEEKEYSSPSEMSAPVHVWTEPSTSGATVLWKLERPEGNLCEICGLEVRLESGENYKESVFDADSGKVMVKIKDLEQGKIYRYTTRWILDDSRYSDTSSEIIFLTEPLTSPVLDIVSTSSTGFVISWESYDTSFVENYVVEITRKNPLHFLPEKCISNANPFEKFIDKEGNVYKFTEGVPSYAYDVTLTTVFTLGLERSSTVSVDTLEDDPGEITLAIHMVFENNVRYSVSADVSWSIPCDVNGVVKKFAYVVTGYGNYGRIENCQMVEYEGGVFTNDDQETYRTQIENILPFLSYKVSLTTHLATHSSTSESTFTSPPVYTPPRIK